MTAGTSQTYVMGGYMQCTRRVGYPLGSVRFMHAMTQARVGTMWTASMVAWGDVNGKLEQMCVPREPLGRRLCHIVVRMALACSLSFVAQAVQC